MTTSYGTVSRQWIISATLTSHLCNLFKSKWRASLIAVQLLRCSPSLVCFGSFHSWTELGVTPLTGHMSVHHSMTRATHLAWRALQTCRCHTLKRIGHVFFCPSNAPMLCLRISSACDFKYIVSLTDRQERWVAQKTSVCGTMWPLESSLQCPLSLALPRSSCKSNGQCSAPSALCGTNVNKFIVQCCCRTWSAAWSAYWMNKIARQCQYVTTNDSPVQYWVEGLNYGVLVKLKQQRP